MNEEIKKLTEEKIAQAMKCETVEELMELAKKEGIKLTEEEAQAFLDEAANTELNEDLLKKVAGGFDSTYNCTM